MPNDEADRSTPADGHGRQEEGPRRRSPGRVALVASLSAAVLFFLLQLGWSYVEHGTIDGDSLLSRVVGAFVFGALWGSVMWFASWRRAGHRRAPSHSSAEL